MKHGFVTWYKKAKTWLNNGTIWAQSRSLEPVSDSSCFFYLWFLFCCLKLGNLLKMITEFWAAKHKACLLYEKKKGKSSTLKCGDLQCIFMMCVGTIKLLRHCLLSCNFAVWRGGVFAPFIRVLKLKIWVYNTMFCLQFLYTMNPPYFSK